jgi:hypothetical protein
LPPSLTPIFAPRCWSRFTSSRRVASEISILTLIETRDEAEGWARCHCSLAAKVNL